MKYFFLIAIFLLTLSCQKESSFANQKGIPDADYNELIALSDTSNMVSGDDVQYKLDRITQIFSGDNDNRGLFPLIYAQTTKQALLSINNEPEKYEVLANATAITLAFAKRYLFNLHDHLLGKKSPEYHWKQYYVLCFSNQPKLRMASAGLNAHLTVDLARAIADIGGRQSYKNDFLQFGEALVEATPDIIADLENLYAVESADLFNGFFLGDIVDPIFGDGATTQFAFQFIRQEAFANAQLLQGPRPEQAQQLLFKNWKAREKLLDDLVMSGLIE